jgi:RHS repeat-associated protein
MRRRTVGGVTYNLTYDAENRLTAMSGATTASFVYDGDGNRVKGTVSGVTTTYIGTYFEWTGSTSSMKKYYYDGRTRVAMRTGNSTLPTTGLNWLLNDHLGSTSITADSSGNRTGELRYKGWGEIRFTYGTTPTSYHFTGQRQESSLGGSDGLYYYNARYYDPYLNRWIQPDTIVPQSTQGVQAWDRFAYANNNPLRYTDPTGHTISCGDGEAGACGGETAESRLWELRHYYLNCQNGTGQNCPNVKGIITFTVLSLVSAGAAGPLIDLIGGYLVGLITPLCMDGDCTNEVNSGIDFLSNQINKVRHIMDPKHAWGSLVNLTGNLSKDYEAIQPYIQQVIQNGASSQINTTPEGNPVIQYVATINNMEVFVTVVRLANGVIQVTDAWVKTE